MTKSSFPVELGSGAISYRFVLLGHANGSGEHSRGRVPRDEGGDRRGHGRVVRGDREVVAILEVDVLAPREQLVDEGSNRRGGSVLPVARTTTAGAVDGSFLFGSEAPLGQGWRLVLELGSRCRAEVPLTRAARW